MSKDIIYREDAIKVVSHVAMECIDRKTRIELINAIPSANRPQGEWTNVGVLTVHCSNCKSEFHELEAMNFCPNCGARMKGVDDEPER